MKLRVVVWCMAVVLLHGAASPAAIAEDVVV